jgi:hypothetical protein
MDEVHSGRSYQSVFGKRLHFGLACRSALEQLRVKWIGDGGDVVRILDVDRLITIVEGCGLVATPASGKLP